MLKILTNYRESRVTSYGKKVLVIRNVTDLICRLQFCDHGQEKLSNLVHNHSFRGASLSILKQKSVQFTVVLHRLPNSSDFKSDLGKYIEMIRRSANFHRYLLLPHLWK